MAGSSVIGGDSGDSSLDDGVLSDEVGRLWLWQLQEAVRHPGSFFLSVQSSGTSGFHPESCLMMADGRDSSAIVVTF